MERPLETTDGPQKGNSIVFVPNNIDCATPQKSPAPTQASFFSGPALFAVFPTDRTCPRFVAGTRQLKGAQHQVFGCVFLSVSIGRCTALKPCDVQMDALHGLVVEPLSTDIAGRWCCDRAFVFVFYHALPRGAWFETQMWDEFELDSVILAHGLGPVFALSSKLLQCPDACVNTKPTGI